MAMSMPISYLENVLHNTTSKPDFPLITDDYLVEVKPGSLVKLIDLVTFWNANHDIIKAEEDKKEECNTIGKDTLTQNQSTGKKFRKSTKKMTTTQK